MKRKLTVLGTICLVTAVLACVALILARNMKGGAEPESAQPVARSDVKRPGRSEIRTRRKPVKSSHSDVAKYDMSKRSEKPVLSFAEGDDDDDDGFTPKERALSKRIEAALDDEDLGKAVACAKEALNCPNKDIREAMIDTLGWFGEKGLPELTPFLVDSDEDVRDSAMNQWSMALAEIEDEPKKIGIVELAMNVLSDEDALENISGEYIGVDEKLAVESLLRVIEAGGSKQGIAKAKETYEFVTGEEFTGREAAEKWIAEEYMPDEVPQQEPAK